MQFQMIFLVAFGVATSAAPLVSVFADKCGNSDPTRACLVGINQLGHNVGFTVAIGQNNNNVDQVLVSQSPNFSIIGLELETNEVACTATCILIDAEGVQTPCQDLINQNRVLSAPGATLNLSNVDKLVAVDCERK